MNHVCYACGASAPERIEWCPRCAGTRPYFPAVTAPSDGVLTVEAVVTDRDLWSRHARYMDLPADLMAVTGRLPAAPFLLALYGPPGAGKSMLAYRLADALADAIGRPVVIASTEEALGPQVSNRLRRLEILRDDLLVTAANDLAVLLDLLRRQRAGALVVDSLTHSTLSGADLARLAREEEVAVVYTLQAT
ncbi:MAG: AAA family ATPase [Planctomycetes bacterium]|nr:AAA family ATPase [Planctomycetota bacterium]